MATVDEVLFDYLPKQEIIASYLRARGKEIESGKFTSPASSSALVANTFGRFLLEAGLLSLPGVEYADTPTSVHLECELRFPWRGGLHPWLDVVLETPTHLIGIESKRYEPYREIKSLFSETFQRDVWGAGMEPYKTLRDTLNEGYRHLDPVQLTKHGFALNTQAKKRNKAPVLIYLYAEPESFPDGKPIIGEHRTRHRQEIERFANAVEGAAIRFHSMSYVQLLDHWKTSNPAQLASHVEVIVGRYSL